MKRGKTATNSPIGVRRECHLDRQAKDGKKRLSGLQRVFEPPDMPRVFVGVTGSGQIASEVSAELCHQWIGDDDGDGKVEDIDGNIQQKEGVWSRCPPCGVPVMQSR